MELRQVPSTECAAGCWQTQMQRQTRSAQKMHVLLPTAAPDCHSEPSDTLNCLGHSSSALLHHVSAHSGYSSGAQLHHTRRLAVLSSGLLTLPM